MGIFVRTSFLGYVFNIPSDDQLTSQHWEEIEPGRVACLHLRGPEGSLDLMACYLATGPAR